MENETICAISTPLGISGIGIIRLSGPKTYEIINKIFIPSKKSSKIKKYSSHTVHYGHIIDGKRIVDEVLITIMKSPKSYTREDMAEIGCHGGFAALKEVLNLCIGKGVRLASPGEFTKRAFLNGRIDLMQAESVLEIIHSQTEKSLEISIKKLKGTFSKRIYQIRKKIFNLLVPIEAKIDFPEEDAVSQIELNIKKEIEEIKKEIEKMLKQAGKGKVIYEGVKTAIIGKTNVGKSSLLNKLLKEERALVTSIPGTTRDFIEEAINIKGIPVKIIDTAGIRKTKREIEKMGVEKALYWMEKAEINILVVDGSKKLNKDDKKLLDNVNNKKAYIVAVNKVDLPLKLNLKKLKETFSADRVVVISAKTGCGIENLEKKIYNLIQQGCGKIDGGEFYLNMREESLLRYIKENLKNALKSCREKLSLELLSEDLKYAIRNIEGITGKNTGEEVLKQIFSQFCIGK